jgi:hypothetical protein
MSIDRAAQVNVSDESRIISFIGEYELVFVLVDSNLETRLFLLFLESFF